MLVTKDSSKLDNVSKKVENSSSHSFDILNHPTDSRRGPTVADASCV